MLIRPDSVSANSFIVSLMAVASSLWKMSRCLPCLSGAFVAKSGAKLRLVFSNIRILPFCQAIIQQYLTFEYDFRAKIVLKRSRFYVFGIISKKKYDIHLKA